MDAEEACIAVDRGELELAVATLPESPFPRLQTQLVWPDPLDFVVGNNHPLAMQTRIGIATLAQHRAIMPARGTVTREILDKALLPHNLRLQVKMETNYLETIKMLISMLCTMLSANHPGSHLVEGRPAVLKANQCGYTTTITGTPISSSISLTQLSAYKHRPVS